MDQSGIYNQYMESYHRLQESSQRFLRIIIAVSALLLVFARRSWIEFFLSLSTPAVGLTANLEGGTISNLSKTMVLNSQPILHGLLLVGIFLYLASFAWAVQVIFISDYLPANRVRPGELRDFKQRIRTGKSYLRIAYLHFATMIICFLLLVAGFLSFYVLSGIWIVVFDVVVSVSLPLMGILWVWWGTPDYDFISVTMWRTAPSVVSAASLAGFIIFVYRPAITGVVVWLAINF